MTAIRWSEIRELFHAVVELPTAEQIPELRRRAQDPLLIGEVQRLLDLHRESCSVLDEPPSAALRLRDALSAPALHEGQLLAGRLRSGGRSAWAAWARSMRLLTATWARKWR